MPIAGKKRSKVIVFMQKIEKWVKFVKPNNGNRLPLTINFLIEHYKDILYKINNLTLFAILRGLNILTSLY